MRTSTRTYIPPANPVATNHCGRIGTPKDLEEQIVQIAFNGIPGNTFYANEKQDVATIVDVLSQGAQQMPEFTAAALARGRRESFVKFPAQIGSVLLAQYAPKIIRKALPQLLLIPSDLQDAYELLKARGHETGGSAWKSAVRIWLNTKLTAFGAMKYQSEARGRGFSMGDIIKVAHPKTADPEKNQIYRYLIGKEHGHEMLRIVDQLSTMPDNLLCEAIEVYRLPHEVVIGRCPNMSAAAYQKLYEAMPPMAAMRMANAACRVLPGELVARVLDAKLTAEAIRGAKILPMRFVTAAEHAADTRVRHVFELALERSLSVTQELAMNGSTFVAVDVSGSMQGLELTQALTLGAAMHLGINAHLALFSSQAALAPTEAKTISGAIRELRSNRVVHQGTHTAAIMPFVDSVNPDNLIILTDGEENEGEGVMNRIKHHRRRINPNLKVFVIDVSKYATSSKLLECESDLDFYVYGANDAALKYVARSSFGYEGLVSEIKASVGGPTSGN